MDMWLVVLHQHQVHTCRGSWYQKNTFVFGGHVRPILKGAKICWLILTDFRRSNIPFPICFPLKPPENDRLLNLRITHFAKENHLYITPDLHDCIQKMLLFQGVVDPTDPSKCFHQFFSGIRRVTAAMLCITSLLTLGSLGVSP